MKYVAYYRVSTKRQGESGLGLQAQKTAVENFIRSQGGQEIPPPFTEVESGKNDDRPELRKAIEHCKRTGSTLLIAKLDRLSRNASFIFKLKEELESAGVRFTACDMPDANTLTIGIMATMAQHERETISKRTRAGIHESDVYKSGEWGNPENLTDQAREKAYQTIREKARTDQSVRHAFHFIKPLREAGESYRAIAEKLNAEGYRTRTGKEFHAVQVSRIYKRLSAES
jgi:DNA invertase Pin-like site-specific DNA recombinase